jgi:VWFA-related protein
MGLSRLPLSRLFCLVFLGIAPAGSLAQSTAPPQQNAPASQAPGVLRATTRLVIVDVVVTDKNKAPVSGLEAEEFTVFEDGKQQQVSAFSFQKPASGSTRAAETVTPLAPDVVTNAPRYAKESVLTVVLLDALNGDFAGHAAARDALVKYLDNAPLNQPLAIFAMQEKLTLLHDFTTDNKALRAVVAKFRPPAQTNNAESLESRASPFATKGDFHTSERNIEATLNQLHALARTLAGYPGRKNVIWLSESFPLVLAPETAVRDSVSGANLGPGVSRMPTTFDAVREMNATTSYAALVKKVTDAMMSAQVAIYPVDSAGLGKDDHLASQHTMNDLAYSTGGRAFYNRNDLEVSLRTSVDDGSTYYTLSYYPENKRWDGKFREISVKTSRPGINLRYRLGYYALDPAESGEADPSKLATDFSQALALDSPNHTAVLFQAKIAAQKKLVANFAIDLHTLASEEIGGGARRVKVSCAVVEFSPKGVPGNKQITNLTATLNAADFQKQGAAFPCQVTIELKPGNHTLRLGVVDRTSHHMGTTSASASVP